MLTFHFEHEETGAAQCCSPGVGQSSLSKNLGEFQLQAETSENWKFQKARGMGKMLRDYFSFISEWIYFYHLGSNRFSLHGVQVHISINITSWGLLIKSTSLEQHRWGFSFICVRLLGIHIEFNIFLSFLPGWFRNAFLFWHRFWLNHFPRLGCHLTGS